MEMLLKCTFYKLSIAVLVTVRPGSHLGFGSLLKEGANRRNQPFGLKNDQVNRSTSCICQ